MLLLSLFTWFSINTVFLCCSFLEHTVFNVLQTFKTVWVDSSAQYIIFIQNSCSIEYPVSCHPYCAIVLSQFSSLTMIYFILGFKSFSPTFLVSISDKCRPPSYQSILYILQFSPFLTKYTLLEIWFVWLVSLTLLAIKNRRLDIQYN